MGEDLKNAFELHGKRRNLQTNKIPVLSNQCTHIPRIADPGMISYFNLGCSCHYQPRMGLGVGTA